ncbi:MAG: hypothetical protein GY754_16220 [bacterium]|nr:hypothetical protein [bacterium]
MSLEDKLREIKRKKEEQSIDWEKTKNDWLEDINYIYGKIDEWFKPLKEDNLIEISKEDKITITEDGIGKYEVNRMKMQIFNFTIIFEPIGTILDGAWGRIDFYKYGNISDRHMILKIKNNDQRFEWKIMSKGDLSELEDFSKERIEQYLEKWIDDE